MVDGGWVAWEPPEWVAARGGAHGLESAHFVVRHGGAPAFPEAEALRLIHWLETALELLRGLVTPYSTRGWCYDGERRKLNVYIGASGLAPWPADAAWAHQGTHVTQLAREHAHPVANPGAKLHHSYLALCADAARNEATVVHELTHCLQMHTGGHVDSPRVGWAWEAHAEFCVHLFKPHDPSWAHNLDAFLTSAHLPPGCTRTHDGAPDGRQYAAWPFFAWVDRRWGAGAAHALWRDDFNHRCVTGASRDPLSTLAARLHGDAQLAQHASDWAAAVATAHFGASSAADAAVRAACDVFAPARFAKLRPAPGDDAHTWRCDAARPLKQHGVCVYRLATSSAAAASVQVMPADADSAAALHYVLCGFDAATGERDLSPARTCADGSEAVQFVPRPGFAYLLAVAAMPTCPVPVPWGVQPSALPTFRYAVRLDGCVQHAASCMPQLPPPPMLEAPQAGTLGVPTGLANLLPCGTGASATERDLRSGEPGATSHVALRHAITAPPAAGGVRLTRVAFSYRVVVGYSSNLGDPGPRFELLAWQEGGATPDGDDDAVDAASAWPLDAAVLYSSPEFAPRPWHYDDSLGGSPTNYCPRVDVDVGVASDARHHAIRGGARLRLGLRFANGARNLHLQGGGWPRDAPCDLQLRLTFAPL